MTKLFASLVFCLLFAASCFATQITVSSFSFDSWTYGGSTATVRVYSNKTFVTSDSHTIVAGTASGFYKTINCTISGGTVSCPSVVLDSTTDSSVPTAKYIADLYDSTGRVRGRWMEAFSVPTSFGATVTWVQLRSYNAAPATSLPVTYYTADQVDALLAGIAPSGSGIVSLANTYSNSLSTAISAIGSTPTILFVDANTTCSTALTVPPTLFLQFSNKAEISKSTGCSIVFQGIGLISPESQIPVFSSFASGDITWTGATQDLRPTAVSTELWDTGNSSLSDRLIRANAAFGTKQVKIVCYPRTSTVSATLSDNKEIYFTPGDYPSTVTWPGSGPLYAFGLGNNTYFHGTPSAKLYESTGLYGIRIVQSVNIDDHFTNIVVEGLSFEGNPSAVADGAGGTTVLLGNVAHSSIKNCYFNNLHAYNAVIGGDGGVGFYSSDSDITGNTFTKASEQVIAVTNGLRIRVANNVLSATAGPEGGQFIDIEPNSPLDTMEDITVENNFITVSDAFDGTNSVGGIAIQGAGGVAEVRGVVVRGNTILGANPETYPSQTRLASAIIARGATDFTIENNTSRWTFQDSIDISNCRNGRIANNHIIAGGDTSGYGSPIHIGGSSNLNIDGNILQQVEGEHSIFLVNFAIYEYAERNWGSSTGSTITKLNAPYPRFYRFNTGQQVFFNGSLYTISAIDSDLQIITVTSSVGTVTSKDFAPSAVNTGTDVINIPAHGYQTGALVTPTSTGTIPAGIPGVPFPSIDSGAYAYVIRVDADNIKLATTLANALANVAVDITSQGTGTHTLHPVYETRFSNNIYKGNDAAGGIILEPTGTSQIVSTTRDSYITTVADADYTATSGSGTIIYTSLTAGRTVNLPDATTCKGKAITVKDGAGGAGAHNITLDGNGSQTIDGSATKALTSNYSSIQIKSDGTNWVTIGSAASASGDVVGPGSATDNAITRFDSTTGKLVQNSLATLSDTGSINIPDGQGLQVNGNTIATYSAGAAHSEIGIAGVQTRLIGNPLLFWINGVLTYNASPTDFRSISTNQFSWTSSTNDPTTGADTGFKRTAAAVIGATDGSTGGGWLQTAGLKRVASNVTNATATMANITDLSITVQAGRKYSGSYSFVATNSTAGEGLQFDFNGGSATVTSIQFMFVATPPGVTLGTTQSAAIGTAITATTATTTSVVYTVYFDVVVNAGGTLIPRVAEVSHTSGTATVKAGSSVVLNDLP
jgi:hypothetical protein